MLVFIYFIIYFIGVNSKEDTAVLLIMNLFMSIDFELQSKIFKNVLKV